MLATVLTVLKILGIVIGAVLALAVLLLILVLFVPVRYKALGNGKSPDFAAKATASWLLFVLRAGLTYEAGRQVITVRVFGIPVKKIVKEPDPAPEEKGDYIDKIVDVLLKITGKADD